MIVFWRLLKNDSQIVGWDEPDSSKQFAFLFVPLVLHSSSNAPTKSACLECKHKISFYIVIYKYWKIPLNDFLEYFSTRHSTFIDSTTDINNPANRYSNCQWKKQNTFIYLVKNYLHKIYHWNSTRMEFNFHWNFKRNKRLKRNDPL